MAKRSKFIPVISLSLAGLLLSGAVLADDVEETEGERCISLSRIDRTHVIDDQQVLFYMRGKDIYLNRLPRRCGGLASQGRFSYKTSMSQLCRMDMITVLQSGGGGLMRGSTCGLGRFIPITELSEARRYEGRKSFPSW